MKILLVNPPDDLDAMLGAGANLITPFEPLGLLYIAAVVRDAGYDVQVIDAWVERLSIEEFKKQLKESNPDIVGFTVLPANGGIVYEVGKWLKEEMPETVVALGNLHASIYDEYYLKNGCCDFVVHGEGEFGFLEAVRLIEKGGRDFGSISSISFLRDGEYVPNKEKGVINDLSELPLPARDLVKQELYNIPSISNLPYSGKKTSIGKHMFTQRGCPYRCSFCTVHHNRKQRSNEVVRAVDEMETLVKKYGCDYIFIMDSLFIANKKRVHAICEEIQERKLDFRWGCQAHVRCVDEDLVKAMEAAGCHDMAFGIESGVDRLLKGVTKTTNIELVEKAVRIVTKNSKIKVSGLFILGLPGETYDDSLQTIRFAKSLPLDMAQFSILTPYPGSEIFEDLKEKGEIDTGIRPDGTLDTATWLRYSAYISYTDLDPIWVTPGLTPEKLKKLQKKAVREFYFRPKQIINQIRRVRFGQIPTILNTAFKSAF
ncbi:radical SAM protein [Candidatus Bathyarchaeota archaeon]|nr:radical SAM protein [Candidatus Bathyarchaeota archaeon]